MAGALKPAAAPLNVAPERSRRPARYWRAALLSSHGDGSRRRRASDATRLAAALLIIVVATALIAANIGPELSLERFIAPPPDGVRRLVGSVWFAGFAGIVGAVAVLARDTRRPGSRSRSPWSWWPTPI